MGTKSVDHEERAGRLWSILTALAKDKKITTYGEAAREIGIHHRPMRFVLEPIQDFCIKEDLPRLTSLVVSKTNGLQGSGYLGIPGHTADLEKVFAFGWNTVANPFSDLKIAELDRIVAELVSDPGTASEKYIQTLSRGNRQRVFRQAVLQAYDWNCCMCGLTFHDSLDAAHIVSWASAKPNLRIDPRNGLALCATHHKLYDKGWLNVTPDYRIVYVDPNQEDGPYSEADVYNSARLHGASVQLPKEASLWPNPDLLSLHETDQE
ncbi:HNH endonuclease [Ciceribacter selenitireducens]|uniref:HNH endonuclease n=1 Tax=Ciceribacter selenitireducens TaxID=448181 RepID=UPI00146FADDD|nr:HNH endonuclease [Ciceribacter selenitireducens]